MANSLHSIRPPHLIGIHSAAQRRFQFVHRLVPSVCVRQRLRHQQVRFGVRLVHPHRLVTPVGERPLLIGQQRQFRQLLARRPVPRM